MAKTSQGDHDMKAISTDAHLRQTAVPMQAIVQSGYGTTGVLRVTSAPRPTPAAGELLVQVHAAGLDRGTWHLMTGRPYLMRIMGFGFSAPNSPVPGRDVAGKVVEIGAGVTRFKVGDVVCGMGEGSFAEYARVPEDKVVHKPANLSSAQAAVLGISGGTALQACDAAGVSPGQRVLIVGASGGVGTYAVQIAKALGAEVTAVCSTPKVELVRALGADCVIDYTHDDFADGREQYDVILDIGGGTSLSRLRRALTKTGRLVFVGNERGGDFSGGFGRQLHAIALAAFVRQRFVMLMAKERASDMERLCALVEQGKLAPVIDRICSLDGVVAALQDLEAGRVVGKVVVRPVGR
jgi:2-desacetyl-2-hydroxyethyl bacteriochlorophyllide A dehydrogenase